jgi:hypothetical protein
MRCYNDHESRSLNAKKGDGFLPLPFAFMVALEICSKVQTFPTFGFYY